MNAALLLVTYLMAAPGEAPTTVARGTLSAIDEHREVVVRTADEWKNLWQQHAGEAAPPLVDFSDLTIVAVFLGTRATAGYDVTIVAVEREGGDVVVRYRESRPAPGMLTAQVLTSPFHIVTVPRFAGAARFERLDSRQR